MSTAPAGLAALATSHRGRVLSYDDAAGLGVIATDDTEFPFHCTAIADGSRRIAVGIEVEFDVRPAALGRLEASDIHEASVPEVVVDPNPPGSPTAWTRS